VIPDSPLDVTQWFIMFIALSIFWYIMRDISRRLGEALHMRRYYLLYDLGEVLLIVAVVMLFTHLVLNISFLNDGADLYPLMAKGLFLAAALIYMAVTIKYWGWIMPEVLARRKK
jgi:hypothetical protein